MLYRLIDLKRAEEIYFHLTQSTATNLLDLFQIAAASFMLFLGDAATAYEGVRIK